MAFWSNTPPGKKKDEEKGADSVTPPQASSGPSVVEGDKKVQASQAAAKPAPQQRAPQAPAQAPQSAAPAQAPAAAPQENGADKYDKFRSALGVGTIISGKLSFDTPVRIDGKLSGEIFSSKALVVGEQGVIDAEVEVATLVIMGSVKGNIRATERIELLASGKLEGDITAPVLVIEDGASFNGRCSMASAAKNADKGRPDPKKSGAPQGKQDSSRKDEPSSAAPALH